MDSEKLLDILTPRDATARCGKAKRRGGRAAGKTPANRQQDLEECRQMYPQLQSFQAWAEDHR